MLAESAQIFRSVAEHILPVFGRFHAEVELLTHTMLAQAVYYKLELTQTQGPQQSHLVIITGDELIEYVSCFREVLLNDRLEVRHMPE